jgi:hypothetical protein
MTVIGGINRASNIHMVPTALPLEGRRTKPRSTTMNRILLASALVLGVSGAAFAQQAPYEYGNYDAAVLGQLNDALSGSNIAVAPSGNFETMTTASIDDMSTASFAPATGTGNVYNAWQANNSGR